MTLTLGFLCVVGALTALWVALFAAPVSRIDVTRRRPPGIVKKSTLTALTDSLVDLVDRRMRSRGWVPFTAKELELAGVRMTPGYLVVMVSMLAASAFMLITLLAQNVIGALVIAALVPLGAKLVLRRKAAARRTAFADQLDETLQLLAAALRAGHGLTRSFDSVSKEIEPPMSEELARVVNENRIGRDLVDAVTQTAERMQNEDFRWVAEAVGIQKETGGNLNEVLDRVGSTIRERGELMREVRTLSAEGRLSAWILAALPVLTVTGLSFINAEFMHPLYSSRAGAIAFVISGILFCVGIMWMRIIVNVKV
jgi:tight adherence protein B